MVFQIESTCAPYTAGTSTRGGQIGDAYVHRRKQLDPGAERIIKWTTCALSGEQLREPVVACVLGGLYNKVGM